MLAYNKMNKTPQFALQSNKKQVMVQSDSVTVWKLLE